MTNNPKPTKPWGCDCPTEHKEPCGVVFSSSTPTPAVEKDWRDSEKEEWGGWKIVSEMLDKPDKLGIYPTSKCYRELYEFVVSQKEKARADERAKLKEMIDLSARRWGYIPALEDILKKLEQ